MNDDHELLTLKEAAERFQSTHRALVLAIHRGKLPAIKRGRDWFVEPGDVAIYLEDRDPRGTRKQENDR